nr:PQQ-binding-like beta-propeller repeat protein [Phytoactinopolyspora mesophila]
MAAAATVAVLVPAGAWRDAINIDSVTTEVVLSEPHEVSWPPEVLWNVDGRSNVASSDAGVFIGSTRELVAYDPVTGERRWSYSDAAGDPAGPSRVTADPDGTRVYWEATGGLVVFDALTGRIEEWLDLPVPVAAGDGQLVVVGRDRTSLEVFGDNGDRQWDAELPGGCDTGQLWPDGKIGIGGDRIFVAAFCDDGPAVFSYQADTGADRRSTRVSATETTDCLNLRVNSGVVAVRTCPDPEPGTPGATTQEIRRLDPDDLSVIWLAEVGEWATTVSEDLAVDEHTVYTTGDRCGFRAVSAIDGEVIGDPDQDYRVEGDEVRRLCVSRLWTSRGVLVAASGTDSVAALG